MNAADKYRMRRYRKLLERWQAEEWYFRRRQACARAHAEDKAGQRSEERCAAGS
jgi:hypothetical protein